MAHCENREGLLASFSVLLLYHKQTIEFCTTKLKGRNGLTFKLSEFSAEFDDFTGLDNTKMKMSIVVSKY